MSVYIANFGRGNWAWPDCLGSSTLVVMDDERVHPFWLSNDRDGYIREAQKVLRLASGGAVPKPVASRWFNFNTILATTAGDLWIHRERQNSGGRSQWRRIPTPKSLMIHIRYPAPPGSTFTKSDAQEIGRAHV